VHVGPPTHDISHGDSSRGVTDWCCTISASWCSVPAHIPRLLLRRRRRVALAPGKDLRSGSFAAAPPAGTLCARHTGELDLVITLPSVRLSSTDGNIEFRGLYGL
jgi:hypothetical protein